jgi:hypothetical protein
MARTLSRVDRVLLSRWFGEALVLVGSLVVMVIALTASSSDEVVQLFGYDVPIMCTWRRLFGVSCPGCGMTRSFVFMAHGAIIEAFRMNMLGPPLFTVVLVQIPYRAARLFKILKEDPAQLVVSDRGR